MSTHEHAAPVGAKFFTRGTIIVTAIMVLGLGVGFYRLVFGLASVSNLSDQYPFGLWKGLNVAAGIALGAAGFSSAAFVYIFNREYFHAIIRPALVIAMLGYTFTGISLMFDLGRWYNIWHPAIPSMWQGNSVLFEVAMCVMVYLTVLYTEFVPVICERFIGRVKLPGRFARLNDLAEQAMRFADYLLGRCLILFIILGVTVSCLHQSSLGMLLVIAPYKLHPLYWSRFLPLFFLTSAIAVGFPTIIFSMMAAAKVFNREPPMHILTPLARYVPYFMGVYVALKLGDMLWRGSYRFLFEGTVSCIVFWADFVLLTLVPFFLFMSSEIRRSQVGLFTAATMFVVGIVLNRCTIFFIAYEPLYAEKVYIPAVAETALAIGFIATMLFLYRAAVTFFPILLAPVKKAGQAAHS